jgi:phosphoesterase RecJ-like protein
MTTSEAAEFLLAHDDFLVLTHRRPDGDTIGCAAALTLALREAGKRAFILQNSQFTPRFAPYLQGLVCEAARDADTVVSVDIASAGLLAYGHEELAGRIALALDHHGSNNLPAPNRVVQGDKAACGEIVYDVIRAMGLRPTPRIADALYIAVSTDTGCFKYSNTSADTLRTAAALVDCGAKTYPINKVFFDTKSLARLQLEARLTTSVELLAGGLVGVCTLPDSWIAELGVTEDDIDSISGFARSIEGVEIGVMVREVQGGEGKISVRTGERYNASEICRVLGGGGHAAAAGASVPGGIEAAKKAVLDVLRGMGIKL